MAGVGSDKNWTNIGCSYNGIESYKDFCGLWLAELTEEPEN